MTITTDPVPSKPVATSLTIQGIVVALIGAFTPMIAKALHLPDDQMTTLVAAVVTVVGGIMGIVGRLRAVQPLH